MGKMFSGAEVDLQAYVSYGSSESTEGDYIFGNCVHSFNVFLQYSLETAIVVI